MPQMGGPVMVDFSELDEIERLEIEELGETIPVDWGKNSLLTSGGFREPEILDLSEVAWGPEGVFPHAKAQIGLSS